VAWQQLTLRLAATELPRIEALLELAGAVSITLGDDGDDAILEPEPGTTPLWPQLIVSALFPADADLGGLAAVLEDATGTPPLLEPVDDAETAAAQTVEPIDIGPRLAIVPADAAGADADRALKLHMGLAFGTGRHPTTHLCLAWLEAFDCRDARVLDYGCGTGVLALAALKLGAAHAVAIDNEPQALAASASNAELNGLQSRLTTGAPGLPLAQEFDLVLANILARPLLELADAFAGLQPPGSHIVLSGLLETQLDMIEQHYRHWYRTFDRRVRDGWGLLTAIRRNGL